jgi:hypothetical protein
MHEIPPQAAAGACTAINTPVFNAGSLANITLLHHKQFVCNEFEAELGSERARHSGDREP